ncbi:glycoside hydrolase superfamily [Lactifluus subvellereus]|nr:glycoside hydrolase superfamily [Lactifluus subvellereus]
MAVAAAGSPDLAERISEASAREVKFTGINWVYSPVADVNSDPRNPVIGFVRPYMLSRAVDAPLGVRSFGDAPEEVAKYVAAVCRGVTKAGVAPSPKHFPGHGDTRVDSHISLPIISKDAIALAQTDLIPFRTASDARAATIMVGHMALPAITGDATPTSLSRVIINGLLRESLGYGGVVVTDCLEMEAVAARKGGVPVAAVDALRAGADIAMICHRFDRQRGAIEAAEATGEGQRIAALKKAFAGDWAQVIIGSKFDEGEWGRLKAENIMLSRHTYASTIALVRNPNDVIPLPKSSGDVVVLTPRMESLNPAVDDADSVPRMGSREPRNTAGPSYLALAASVGERVDGASLHDVYSPEEPFSAEVEDAIDRAASVLFVTRNADQSRSAWQLDRLQEVLRLRRESRKVVVLASCGPYDLLAAPELEGLDGVGYVACFEFTVNALDAAAAVIFGEKEAKGRVPVCGGNVLPGCLLAKE